MKKQKLRAKSGGKWVKGEYSIDTWRKKGDKHAIKSKGGKDNEVDAGSVFGRLTEYTDANGVELWEHDIVGLSGVKHVCSWVGHIGIFTWWDPEAETHTPISDNDIFEIIGNSIDNPELIDHKFDGRWI